MIEDDADQMRNFIVLAEYLSGARETMNESEIVSPVEQEAAPNILITDLENIVFRLRGFMEDSGGEYALGIETGMQRAADMIENLIKRHTEGNNLG